jgi:hypothetical protein
MIDALYNYVKNTEDPESNYSLAREYHKIGHTSSAISFYLRCAERTESKTLAYECLLHMYVCFQNQGDRPYTEKGLLEKAICVLPKRPEAYFLLSRYHEWRQEYAESYTIAEIALNICDFESEPLRENLEYYGKYLLIFEKAVSAWWLGKAKETRELFHHLADEYYHEMDEIHQKSVERNLSSLGSGPESHAFTPYYKEDHKLLRFKFNGSELIETNHAQIYQDMFVLSMLNGKTNGTFLEIGGAAPYHGNNTALLEEKFNWNGVSIEYQQHFVDEYTAARRTKVLCADALEIDYKKLLQENFNINVIDYLQLDIEPPRNTYDCMLNIPFDEYKFAVITYEHDYYVDVTKSYREKSREFLKSKGYILVVNDLSPDGVSNFEDWWVHPDLIDPAILNKMICVSSKTKKAKDYILSPIDESKNFTINQNFTSTGWIVDNFYENPDDIRKFALDQEYIEGGFGKGFIGRRTEKPFLFNGLKEKFEDIMGKKIINWEENLTNGRFQISWAGEPLVYHCDEQKWGGIIYLTPDAPYQCGTTLYAHKETKARTYYDDGWDAAWKNVPGDPHLDGTAFEPVDVIGNVYNRLVIFDASCIHSASQYFGTVKDNARLWQMFFFDTEL